MATANKLQLPTEYSKIFDYYYEKFNSQMKRKRKISPDTKASIIDYIFTKICDPADVEAIRVNVKYHGDCKKASKMMFIDARRLSKIYDKAVKKMYWTENITRAIPNYYKVDEKGATKLTKYDFGEKQYIITALNKTGIYYKEQLLKHLSNGWYYLWTIPGCGDAARQRILMTIDEWNGR